VTTGSLDISSNGYAGYGEQMANKKRALGLKSPDEGQEALSGLERSPHIINGRLA
jgi:hypothetical protein